MTLAASPTPTPSGAPTGDLVRRSVATPIGALVLAASPRGLRAVLWPDEREGRVPLPDDIAEGDSAVLDRTEAQLAEYFAGRRTDFDLDLDPTGTPFQREVWTALAQVPHGETISYAALAGRLGDRRRARAVGAAVGRNPLSIVVPCHRVVGADGSLTGFAGGLEVKRRLLDHERGVATLDLGGPPA